MLADSQLKDLLSKKELRPTDKLLICLASDNLSAKSVKTIKQVAFSNGWRQIQNRNVSALLSNCQGHAVRSADGWELTSDGRSYVASLVGPLAALPAPKMATSLRIHLAALTNPTTKAFVEEGVECFEHTLYRSAVVLTWVGAIAVLQEWVLANKLTEFNNEAARRTQNSKNQWKIAKTTDDLSLMKEHEFLQVLEAISVIGKNVKQLLEQQLKLRNGCGHPNSMAISENATAAHIEVLILNVFSKFS